MRDGAVRETRRHQKAHAFCAGRYGDANRGRTSKTNEKSARKLSARVKKGPKPRNLEDFKGLLNLEGPY